MPLPQTLKDSARNLSERLPLRLSLSSPVLRMRHPAVDLPPPVLLQNVHVCRLLLLIGSKSYVSVRSEQMFY